MLDHLVDTLPLGLRPYAKAVLPAAAAILAALVHALTAGTLDVLELEIAVVGLLAASVAFAVENAPAGVARYAKAIVPALMTAAAVAVHWLLTHEWNQEQWALALTGFGAALLTFLTPNDELVVDLATDPAVDLVADSPPDALEDEAPPPAPAHAGVRPDDPDARP